MGTQISVFVGWVDQLLLRSPASLGQDVRGHERPIFPLFPGCTLLKPSSFIAGRHGIRNLRTIQLLIPKALPIPIDWLPCPQGGRRLGSWAWGLSVPLPQTLWAVRRGPSCQRWTVTEPQLRTNKDPEARARRLHCSVRTSVPRLRAPAQDM